MPAKRLAARCALRLGRDDEARKLEAEAGAPCRRVSKSAFWCPEIETYALALDGKKKPCRVRTSNAGQVLFTGIAAPERAALVAKGLLQTQLLFRLGHPHRGAAAKPATIRCRITTARSGRTTMR